MENEVRSIVEGRLGSIENAEWDKVESYAERKLESLIKRFGDENGLRKESWYLAELIYETITQNRFSKFTIDFCRFMKEVDEEMAIKKGQPVSEDNEPTITLNPIVAGI